MYLFIYLIKIDKKGLHFEIFKKILRGEIQCPNSSIKVFHSSLIQIYTNTYILVVHVFSWHLNFIPCGLVAQNSTLLTDIGGQKERNYIFALKVVFCVALKLFF
jgi:hypothetical protein